jgi:hypothetical protein
VHHRFPDENHSGGARRGIAYQLKNRRQHGVFQLSKNDAEVSILSGQDRLLSRRVWIRVRQ